jgi:hypothetical protein
VTAACADASPSCTSASKAVDSQTRWPAAHGQTVTQSGGHRKQARRSDRRTITAQGATNNDAHGMERAKTFWQWRWSRRKKPALETFVKAYLAAHLDKNPV